MIKILVSGCGGKMGRTVTRMIDESNWCEVVAGVDKYPPANQPFPIFLNYEDCAVDCDVIIDFSRPDILPSMLDFAQQNNAAVVLATTGFSSEENTMLNESAKKIPLFKSANMSLGVNVVKDLLQQAARTLQNDYDIEIIEAHHNRKVDAPSGTALLLADAINECYGGKKRYIYGRYGGDNRRTSDEIGIHAIRGGNIVGEHCVQFIGQNELIEVSHSAQSRDIFALGALRAAQFIADQSPGLYSMKHLIGAYNAVTRMETVEHQSLLSLYDIDLYMASEIFTALAQNSINIDMISQSASKNGIDISFTVDESHAQAAYDCIQENLTDEKFKKSDDISKLSIQGQGMEDHSGIAASLYSALLKSGIVPLLITTSETKISCGIQSSDLEKATTIIKETYSL